MPCGISIGIPRTVCAGRAETPADPNRTLGRISSASPSAIEVVGTRYASPTSRLEAGAPSASEGAGDRLRPSVTRFSSGLAPRWIR